MSCSKVMVQLLILTCASVHFMYVLFKGYDSAIHITDLRHVSY